MNLVNWSPIRDVGDMFSRYNQLFDFTNPRRIALETGNGDFTWRPVSDVLESDEEYLIKAELPEVSKDDVKVSVEDGMLKIAGERKFEKTYDKDKQHRIESFYGTFERSFSLPDDVDAERIEADCHDGVLKVHLPKTPISKSSPKQISVK